MQLSEGIYCKFCMRAVVLVIRRGVSGSSWRVVFEETIEIGEEVVISPSNLITTDCNRPNGDCKTKKVNAHDGDVNFIGKKSVGLWIPVLHFQLHFQGVTNDQHEAGKYSGACVHPVIRSDLQQTHLSWVVVVGVLNLSQQFAAEILVLPKLVNQHPMTCV